MKHSHGNINASLKNNVMYFFVNPTKSKLTKNSVVEMKFFLNNIFKFEEIWLKIRFLNYLVYYSCTENESLDMILNLIVLCNFKNKNRFNIANKFKKLSTIISYFSPFLKIQLSDEEFFKNFYSVSYTKNSTIF